MKYGEATQINSRKRCVIHRLSGEACSVCEINNGGQPLAGCEDSYLNSNVKAFK